MSSSVKSSKPTRQNHYKYFNQSISIWLGPRSGSDLWLSTIYNCKWPAAWQKLSRKNFFFRKFEHNIWGQLILTSWSHCIDTLHWPSKDIWKICILYISRCILFYQTETEITREWVMGGASWPEWPLALETLASKTEIKTICPTNLNFNLTY